MGSKAVSLPQRAGGILWCSGCEPVLMWQDWLQTVSSKDASVAPPLHPDAGKKKVKLRKTSLLATTRRTSLRGIFTLQLTY